ncbi:hypothetical protein BI364_08160 [Acidihalobacter yilgarnensis]|uniref:Tyr recombinase domain-containing protein n=2 Tax=Acidihalobacter yilgarnensis TaxID=2819280 RepID=A0A1D8IN89_9GAMM|nr:hypothetical protein BI364_08160 [Acidihalobacter yilgarnensis]
MPDMSLQTHLLRRGGIYYFRAKIPVDLQLYLGKREEKFSLKTRDPQEARSLARRASADFDRRCAMLRDEIAARQRSGTGRVVDEALIQEICMHWRHQALAGDEQIRILGQAAEERRTGHAEREVTRAALKETLSQSALEAVEPALKGFLYLNGLHIDQKDTEGYRRLLYRFLQTVTEVHDQQLARDAGEVVWTPEAPLTPRSPTTPGLSLETAFEDWKRFDPSRPARTVADVRRVVDAFQQLTAHKPLETIERQEVIAYRDQCIAQGLSAMTVSKKIALLCALFNVAIDSGKLRYNPAQRVSIPRGDRRQRKPFDLDDLKRIFGPTLYTRGLGRKTGAAGIWLPLLALYQGCRVEELAQLRVADVQHAEGVDYLNIDDDTDATHTQGAEAVGKRLKNTASRRRLPLHPAVIAAGFLDYVEQVRAQHHHRLFPSLTPDKDGKYSSTFSKAFMRYLRSDLEITDRSKVFHSFRHRFRSACRDAGLDEEIADALMGHSDGQKTGRHYGERFSLIRLHEAISRIQYPGLEIPRHPSH